MTFKEKLEKDFPEKISVSWRGGCRGCPFDYGYEDYNPFCNEISNENCTRCWNREVPGTEEEERVFTKNDLKDGMLVEVRKGTRFLIVKGNFIGETSWFSLKDLKEDLTCDSTDLDVMRVFESQAKFSFNTILKYPGNLIWERKTAKELTATEAAQLLKEKFPEYSEIKITV